SSRHGELAPWSSPSLTQMSQTCEATAFDRAIRWRPMTMTRDHSVREHGWRRRVRSLAAALIALGGVAGGSAAAQTPSPRVLTLLDAIESARTNYPSLKELRARAAGAEEGIGLARTAYVPRLDALWQANRSTRNNVFGLLLPQGVVPPISG